MSDLIKPPDSTRTTKTHNTHKYLLTQATLEDSTISSQQDEVRRLREELAETRKQILQAELVRAQEIRDIRESMQAIERELLQQKDRCQDVENRNRQLEEENKRLLKIIIGKEQAKKEEMTQKSRFLETAAALRKRNIVESLTENTIKKQNRTDIYQQNQPVFKPTQSITTIVSRPSKLTDQSHRLESKIKSLDNEIKKSRQKLSQTRTLRFQY